MKTDVDWVGVTMIAEDLEDEEILRKLYSKFHDKDKAPTQEADNDNEISCFIEHGNVFKKIEHVKINKH